MNDQVMKELYDVVMERRAHPQEGSYTCYLFEQGLDKILKKVGEECSETIIAAKNEEKEPLTMEICDLLYHLTVLMAQRDVSMDEVLAELKKRGQKIGNLKVMKKTDRHT